MADQQKQAMQINTPLWRAFMAQYQKRQQQKRGGDDPVAVLPHLDYLMIVGSSTMVETFSDNPDLGRQEQSTRSYFAAAGIDIPIINRAVSGQTIGGLDSVINGYLTDMGSPTKTVGVLISIGSNNIGQTAYNEMLPATRATMLTNLNTIADKVVAAGFLPIITTIQSRPTFEDMYEEWADLMYRPLCEARSPDWYAAPLAVMDFCRLYRDNKDVPNWWQADNVHPLAATPVTQEYVADQLATYADIPAMSTADRFLFSWSTATRYYIGGMNTLPGAATGTFSEVYNARGQLVGGASLSWSGATGSSGGATGNPGVWDVGLENHRVQLASLYRQSAPMSFTAAFGAAYANRTGTLRATGNSSTANRFTLVTAGASSAIISASVRASIVELPFTLDASGTMTFTAAPSAPSSFANLSGVEFLFS